MIDKDSWLQRQQTSEQRRQRVFRHSCCRAFGSSSQAQEEASQDRCDMSTVAAKTNKHREVLWQQYHLCLAVAEHQILGGNHLVILGPESGRIWWLKKVQYL